MGPGPYTLKRGTTTLGAIDRLDPSKVSGWLDGSLRPAPAWGAVAPLFEAEAEALKYADRFFDSWQDCWDAAHGPGITIVDADGAEVAVSAHVDGLSLRVQPS